MSRTSFRFLLQLLLAVVTTVWSAQGLAQSAPGVECTSQGVAFTASLNGRPLDLTPFPGGMFSIFPTSVAGDVVIHSKFDVRWVQVRPLSAHVAFSIGSNHRDVHLKVSGVTPLTVEFNDSLAQVVHLFPYTPDRNAPGNGQPGMHYFGPGMQSAGVIELKSGDVVYLAPGAWVKGAIRARYVHDVHVTGHGVLDASDIKPHDAPYGGVSPIYFDNVQNAQLSGITVYNSHGWTVVLRGSNGAQVDGLHILNPNAWNADDGIDLVSSSHVTISNIFVRTNDDCIAIKNLNNVDTSDIHIQHAVLWNMPLGGNGVEIGFETGTSNVHDVHYDDIDMIHVERGAALSIHNGDSGSVSDITYSNIRVEDARRKLMDFAVVYGAYGTDRPTSQDEVRSRMDHGGAWDGILCSAPNQAVTVAGRRGHISNVSVRNLQVVDGALAYSVIAGFDAQHSVQGVQITGLSYVGKPLSSLTSARVAKDFVTGFTIR